VLAALAVTACGGGTEDGTSRDAQVYAAAIRDVLADDPPREPTDPLPVVYIIGVGEGAIEARVQADVAQSLDEDADVRFADERSEAVLKDEEHVPVRDHGVLVAIGVVPPDADPVDVQIEVYRSEDDWSKRVLTIGSRSSQWTVTAESVLPADAP
jgi:hypothetical protein